MTLEEFVLSFSVDASKFVEGQRRVDKTLLDLEKSAERSSKAISGTTDKSLRGMLSGFNTQFVEINQNLRRLAEQSVRTGGAVAHGASQGASGLAALATAGLNAYAVLKLVQGVTSSVINTAATVTAQSQTAGYTGVAPARVRSIARGAYEATGADEGATQNALFGLRQRIAGRNGANIEGYTSLIRTLSLMGVNPNTSGNDDEVFQDILTKLHPALGRMSQPDQQLYGGQLGLPQQFTQALALSSAAELEAKGRLITADHDQTEELNKLTGYMRQFNAALSGMTEKIAADLAPTIGRVVTYLAGLIVQLQQTPGGRAAFGVGAAAAGGGVLWGTWRAVRGMVRSLFGVPAQEAARAAAEATPAIADAAATTTAVARFWAALGRLSLWGALSTLGGDTPEGTGRPKQFEDADRGHFLGGTIGRWVRGLFGGPGRDPQAAQRDMQQALAQRNSEAGGAGGGSGGPGRAGGAISSSARAHQAMDYFVSRGWTPAQSAGIVGRLWSESIGLKPDAHNDIGGGHTGLGQWDHERWPRFLSMYNGDTSFERQLEYVDWELNNTERRAGDKIRAETTSHGAGVAMESYERARNPSFTEQAASVADQLYLSHVSKKVGPASAPSNQGNDAELRRKYDAAVARFNETERKAGDHYATSHPETFEQWKARNTDYLKSVDGTQPNLVSGGALTHNHNIDIGDVHVHLPPGTPANDVSAISDGISDSLRNRVKREFLVNQSGTGLR